MSKPVQERELMRVVVHRRIFITFLMAVVALGGFNTYESAKLREDRRVFEELKDELKDTKAIAERADDQVRAVRDFTHCGFVLVLGLDLPQSEAESVIEQCVKKAKFPKPPGPLPVVDPK